jgi:Mrp family chromosome partitioning ATPase
MFKSTVDVPGELKKCTKLPLLCMLAPGDDEENIRNVRSNLLAQLKDGQRVIMVTSDRDGDGKTWLAKSLAESLTAIGKTAQYIDCDLRKSARPDMHPADYFATAAFIQKIDQAKVSNDYIILDTPSLGKFADANIIGQQADATIYMVKAGSTPKTVLEALDEETRLPEPMLVLNAVDMSKRKYKFLVK